MNEVHKNKLKQRDLKRLRARLKIIQDSFKNFPSDDIPARLILVESKIKEQIFRIENK